MRLGTIFYLYRVRLRARLVQELLAAAGIAVGVALLFASQVANTSLTGSVSQLTSAIVGKSRLQITARDPLGFQQDLLEEVQKLPGVLAAVPLLQRSVNLVGPKGSASVDLIGVGVTAASLDGQMLKQIGELRLSNHRGVLLPAPVARLIGVGPLQPMQLQIAGRSQTTLAAAILQASDLGELVDSPVAIASLYTGQQLTGMQGRINRLIVEPRSGREPEVESELTQLAGDRLNVRQADAELAIFQKAEAPASQSTELFSVISALVGFMFAFNAMLLTLPQRRNLIDDLRLDGYPPLEIAEMMLFDAIVLGVVGSAVGLALGELLSSGLLQANPGYLSFAFPVSSVRIVTWQSLAIACGGGLLAAAVGVAIPLRSDIFPKDDAARRGGARRLHITRWFAPVCVVAGIGVTAAALVEGIDDIGTAVLVFTILTLAMLASLPLGFGIAVDLFDLLQRPVRSVSARIAVIELQSRSTRARSLAIAATGAIAVFGSVSIEGAKQNLESGLDRVARETTRAADIWISPRGASNTLATASFGGGAVLHAVEGIPGIASIRAYRGGFLDVGSRRVLVIAEPRQSPLLLAPGQVVRGDSTLARDLMRGSHWAAMSLASVEELGLRIGQSFTMPTPRLYAFRLAAITTNYGWPPGALIMNADDFARAWGTDEVNAYQIDVDPSASAPHIQQEIRSALGPRSALMVQTGGERETSYRATLHQGLSRLGDITALVLTAAVLAMAAAMGAMLWQRRPRLAGMKVDGFGQGELWGALLDESAVLLATGCTMGAVFGLLGQVVLGHALAGITGFPVIVAIGGIVAVLTVAGVTLVAVSIVALPGYFATQVRPALQD